MDQLQRLKIKREEFPRTNSIKLKLSIKVTVVQTVLDGRVKNFTVRYSGKDKIPVLPSSIFCCIITKQFYDKSHGDVDTMVTLAKRGFWIQKLRKIVSLIEVRCRIYNEKRKHYISQVMGDLTDIRTKTLPPFLIWFKIIHFK